MFQFFTRKKFHDEASRIHKNNYPNSNKKGEGNKMNVLEGETNIESTPECT